MTNPRKFHVKNIRLFFSLFFLLSFSIPVLPLYATTPVGDAIELTDRVDAKDENGQSRRLSQNDSVQFKDTISTDSSGFTKIELLDKTLFSVGSNSELIIDEFVYDPNTKDGQIDAKVVKGFFRMVTGEIAKKNPEKMNIELPVGQIGVRGTTLGIRSIGQQSLAMLMKPEGRGAQKEKHKIVVRNQVNGQWKETVVDKEGHGSTIDGPNQAPSPQFKVPDKDREEIENNTKKKEDGDKDDTGGTPPPPPNKPLPNNYEKAELESVEPGSSTSFDPFTFGRPGSPYGPDGAFSPGGAGGGCKAPLIVEMSPKFADPGDTHGNIIILGNGEICKTTINGDDAGVVIQLSQNFATTVKSGSGWSIVSLSESSGIVITNGKVTMSFSWTRAVDAITVTEIKFV